MFFHILLDLSFHLISDFYKILEKQPKEAKNSTIENSYNSEKRFWSSKRSSTNELKKNKVPPSKT